MYELKYYSNISNSTDIKISHTRISRWGRKNNIVIKLNTAILYGSRPTQNRKNSK